MLNIVQKMILGIWIKKMKPKRSHIIGKTYYITAEVINELALELDAYHQYADKLEALLKHYGIDPNTDIKLRPITKNELIEAVKSLDGVAARNKDEI